MSREAGIWHLRTGEVFVSGGTAALQEPPSSVLAPKDGIKERLPPENNLQQLLLVPWSLA